MGREKRASPWRSLAGVPPATRALTEDLREQCDRVGHPSYRALCARSAAAGGTVLTIATVSRIFTPDPRAGYRSLPDWTYYQTLLQLLGVEPDDYQSRWEQAQHEWQNRPRFSTTPQTTDIGLLRPETDLPNSDLVSPVLTATAPGPNAGRYVRARGRRPRQQWLLLVATGIVLLGAIAVSTWVTTRADSNPAKATVRNSPSESCQRNYHNLDAGEGTVAVPALAYRTGPAADCPVLGHVPAGTVIYYHCSIATRNEIWTHGRVKGTHEEGWFRYHDLGQGQQLAPC